MLAEELEKIYNKEYKNAMEKKTKRRQNLVDSQIEKVSTMIKEAAFSAEKQVFWNYLSTQFENGLYPETISFLKNNGLFVEESTGESYIIHWDTERYKSKLNKLCKYKNFSMIVSFCILFLLATINIIPFNINLFGLNTLLVGLLVPSVLCRIGWACDIASLKETRPNNYRDI